MRYFSFIIMLLLLISSINLHSAEYATDTGSYKLGGTVSFDYYVDPISGARIIAQPQFGCFVAKNFMMGILMDIQYSEFRSDDKRTGLGPVLGYYFGGEDKKIIPYLLGGFFYSDIETFNSAGTTTILTFSFGIDFLISKNIAIDTGISYNLDMEESGGFSTDFSRLRLAVGVTSFIY